MVNDWMNNQSKLNSKALIDVRVSKGILPFMHLLGDQVDFSVVLHCHYHKRRTYAIVWNTPRSQEGVTIHNKWFIFPIYIRTGTYIENVKKREGNHLWLFMWEFFNRNYMCWSAHFGYPFKKWIRKITLKNTRKLKYRQISVYHLVHV